jgi:hypothetical protein
MKAENLTRQRAMAERAGGERHKEVVMKKAIIASAFAALMFLPLLNPAKSVKAQQDPPRRDCCFHIYSAGSNLGWACSLLNYTSVRTRLEPADETTLNFILAAGNHIHAAHATCSALNPAWRDWAGRKQFLEGLVNNIRQRPIPIVRSQTAFSIRSTYQWADALRVRIFNEQAYEHDTCAEKYFKLGFLLAYAQQTLGIAEERMQQGRNDWTEPVSDARSYLGQSLQVLNEYFGIAGCTEVKDLNLQVRITNLLNADSRGLRAINQEMRATWESLQQRLLNRCEQGTGPAPDGGGNIVGQWVVSFGGRGGEVGTPEENVIRNRGGLIITRTNGGYAGKLQVIPLPWEDLLDVSYSNGVLRFTRSPRFYHQAYEAVVRGNRLEGTFRPWNQRQAYKWWGEKVD